MWNSLAKYEVTYLDTGHTAGLIKLARALNEIHQTDIADMIWIGRFIMTVEHVVDAELGQRLVSPLSSHM